MKSSFVVRVRKIVGRPLRRKGLLIATVFAVSIPTVALAGTGVGGVFNLGVTNTVNKLTSLVGTTSKMLQVTNKSTSPTAVAIGATSKGHGAPTIRATNTGGGPALGLSGHAGTAPCTAN